MPRSEWEEMTAEQAEDLAAALYRDDRKWKVEQYFINWENALFHTGSYTTTEES